MNSSRQIKYGALISYISIFVNIIYGLLFTPWLVRTIGQSQYGLYTLATSLITLFIVDFGLSAAASKFIAQYHAEGDEEKVNRIIGTIYKLYFGIDILISAILVVVFFFIDQIYVALSPLELEQFKIVYIIAALSSTITFPFITLNGILNAYEKFVQLKAADLLYRFLLLILMSIVLYLDLGLYAVVIVNGITSIIVIIYKLVVIKRTTAIKVDISKSNSETYKLIIMFSLWTTVATLANRLIFTITPSILGAVANSSEVAVFGIIITIEGYVYLITSAINGMFMPKISRIYAEKRERQILPLMIKVGRFQYGLNGLIIAGFIVLGKPFILLWMGSDYQDAYIGIILVVLPGLFYNSLQIANTAMTVQNKVHLPAIVALVCGLINVTISIFLSSSIGTIGACISIFIAYMIRAILMHLLHYTKMNINIFAFIKACYIKMSMPIVITITIGLLLSFSVKDWNWIIIILIGIVLCGIYFVAVFLFSLSKDERTYIKTLITTR